jgi:putative ABC transport system permease protein
MLKNYLKTDWRTLLRAKTYSLINMVSLSLGLACAMLIILYIRDETSYDRFHHHVQQIYRVDRRITRENGARDAGGSTGYLQGPAFATRVPEIEQFVRVRTDGGQMKRGTDVMYQSLLYADPDFFSVFNFPLISGNPSTALTQTNSVVISEDMAKAQFGTTDAMGKTLEFQEDNKWVTYQITGVAKNNPQNSSIKFEVIMPLKMPDGIQTNPMNWFSWVLTTFVVLRPDANLSAVNQKMNTVYRADASDAINMIKEKYGVKDPGISYFVQPMTDIHLSKEAGAGEGLFDASDPTYAYILGAIAGFILFIACINFVNLTVAHSIKRAKEIGVRKVIGGSRGQVIFQFFAESFLLCSGAFLLALLLVQWALPLFNRLSGKSLAFAYLLDARLVLSYVTLFVLTTFVAGIYPALMMSRFQPVKTLYGRVSWSGGKHFLQKSLVVMQFSLATAFILGTLTLVFQLNYLSTQPLGYNDKDVLMVYNYGLSRNDAAVFKKELMRNPAILNVAPKNPGNWGTTVKVAGDKVVNNITLETVDSAYLPTIEVPVAQGRNFSAAFIGDSSRSILVNQAFVDAAGWQDPIGQRVHFYEPDSFYTVVGVVKDYHYKPLTDKIGPQVFTMNPRNGYGMVYIKIVPHSEAKVLPFIQSVFKRLFPMTPFSYDFKEEVNRQSYAFEKRWREVILWGAALMVFISCMGLFGLTVLSAERRTKEVGIRKVLGASVSRMVVLLSTDFLKLVLISLLIAFPVAWVLAGKWLEQYPYRISLSWWMFGLAGCIMLVLALVTMSFHTIKAALRNPVNNLRTE